MKTTMAGNFTPSRPLPIKRLVFSGGGAKGVVYPGAYQALVETGVFQDVDEVAGVSVGSITAAFIAMGISPKRFRQLTNIDFTQLMGNRVGKVFGHNAKGVRFFTKDGRHLLEFIRKGIIEAIQSFREEVVKIENFLDSHPEVKTVLDKLDTDSPVFTFRDLAILNQIAPKGFKKLTMIGAIAPHCELQIFNDHLTPDVEVALACRASSSIPGIFEPVTIQIGSEKKTIIDGGVFDNLPTQYFETDGSDECTLKNMKAQTLVFAFGEGVRHDNTAVFHAIHGNRPRPFEASYRERFERNVLASRLGEITPGYDLVARKEEGFNKLREEFALRTVELHVSTISTRDFALASQKSREMSAMGYLDSMNYVINHELYDEHFQPNQFYQHMIGVFDKVYRAVLLGAGKNPEHDELLVKMKASGRSLQNCFHHILSDAYHHVDSPVVFALSRSVEFINKQIDAETLFKETYEESFKQSSFFSISKITGECIFFSSTLHDKLNQKNMFDLFDHRAKDSSSQTRTQAVFDSLNQIDEFNHDYQAYEQCSVDR